MALSSLLLSHFPIPKPKPHNVAGVRCSTTPSSSSSSFDLRTYWSALVTTIESELDSALPLRHPERIHSAMRHAVLPGSFSAKRAPPILCVAVSELFSTPRAASLPTAVALELCYAASLVHDDLPCFDAAPTRRGHPSTHAAYGTDIAVLAGDALFPLAFNHIISHTPPNLVPHLSLLKLLAELARAVGSTGMAAGQFLDLTGTTTATERGVVDVLEKKFGEMAECSAACGAILGGAGELEEAALRRYGRAIGVLYELVDDVLMASGNGKMRSNASVVRALGMDRGLQIVEELKTRAKKELGSFGEKYGREKVLPLYSFVDFAAERGFELEKSVAPATSA